MTHTITIDVDKIYNAISQAEHDGATELLLNVNVKIDKKNKPVIEKMYLSGFCTNEYIVNI